MRTSLILIIAFIAHTSNAQNRTYQLDSLFTKLYKENKFTGNVLIAENGKPILQKSYGKAFREKDLDLNNETVFELASVSKQFTAMGIMLLKKQGKLSYEDTLTKFFPNLPYHNITIRQLLQHTSGLPDYLELAEKHWDNKKIMTNSDMIAMLEKHRPEIFFSPGEKWEYCNTGYVLLGSILEKVSGQSFGDFLSANIFKPLGMNRTRVYRKRFEKTTIDNYAYGYVKDEKENFVMADSLAATASMVYSMDGIYGDGVVNSTTGDLLKWDQALYTEKLVSKKMMNEAFTDAKLNNEKTFNYGFGWLLATSDVFGKYHFHSGGWPGYTTWMERHPQSNKTIILLANAGGANNSIKAIRNILYGIKNKPPVEIKLDEKTLHQYTGNYKFQNGDTLRIQMEAGKLFADVGGRNKHQLFAEAVDLFFRTDRDDVRVRIIRSDGEKVTGVQILREGPAIEAVRIE